MANMRDDGQPDDTLDQRALLDQLGGNSPFGANTGVAGNPAEVAASRGMAAPVLQVPGAEPPAAQPKQTYNLEGYDAGKLASDHDSAKYQIGRTLQNYDYKQGITPEVLTALNALGIGSFSGQGDKLNITGGSHGLQGDTNLDVVHGFNNPNGPSGWQYGVESDDATRAGGAKPPMATSAGLPQPATATNSLNVPTDASFFNDLIARMRAGAGNDVIDQSALLNQLR